MADNIRSYPRQSKIEDTGSQDAYKRLVAPSLAAATVLMVLWPVLFSRALIFDDPLYLLENPLVRNPSWASVWRLLSEVRAPSTVEGYYHPLGLISLMIDYALGGRPDHLIVFRATSLLLHVACTVLVASCVWSLFRNAWVAGVAGLWFGLHPCSVESIAWLSDRKTLLAGLFSFAALLLHLKYVSHRKAWTNVLGLVCFLLAMMAKPMSVPLPAMLLCLDVWPLSRFGRRAVLEKIPYFLLAAGFSVITMISQPRLPDILPHPDPQYGKAILVFVHNMSFYTHKTLWPAFVSALYPFPVPLGMESAELRWGVGGTMLFAVIALVSWRWTRSVALGWFAFLCLLLPAILVPVQPLLGSISHTEAIAADRFTYIAKIALLIPLAGGLATLLKRKPFGVAGRNVLIPACVLLAVGEAVVTRTYIAKWKDNGTMTRHLASVAPESAHVQVALGNILCSEGAFDEAVPVYERAIALGEHHVAHEGLAAIRVRQGRIKDAESQLRAALKINPMSASAHESLGRLLDHGGHVEEAISEFEQAVAFAPRSARIRVSFGIRLFKHRRTEEAMARFEEAIKLDSLNSEARYQIGCIYMTRGQAAQAVAAWREALSLAPDSLPIMNNLAWALATSDEPGVQDSSEAVSITERAAQLSGRRDYSILETLAASYADAGRFEEAQKTATECIELCRAVDNVSCVESLSRQLNSYRQRRPLRESINRESFYP